MKKVLAIVLCVCLVFALSVSAMALESPQNNVIFRKCTAEKDGTTVPEDTFIEVAEDGTVTAKANEAKYGTFNSWSIYVISDVTGTSAATSTGVSAASVLELAVTQKATVAKEGVDYTVVSGNLKSQTLVIKPINRLAICGNYSGTITDPLSASSVPGTKSDKSGRWGDLNVMYVAIVMLAAGAVLFGAKRQLSK